MARGRVMNDVQTAVRMPRELYERLQAAGRPIGEEIRQRLEESFAAEPPAAADPKTAQLLGAISKLAGEASGYFGRWHERPYAFRVLHGGIEAALRFFKPSEDVGPGRDPKADKAYMVELFFGGNEPPETIGRVLAGMALTGWADFKPPQSEERKL
jgi:hypothetical protein